MAKIVILTHGAFANGIYETVKLFADTCNIEIASLNVQDNLDDFKIKVKKMIFENDVKDILVMVDLFGGTPFNTVVKVCNDETDSDKNIEIISGLNLPMILEAVLNINDKPLKEVKNMALESGKNGIRDFYSEIYRKECD